MKTYVLIIFLIGFGIHSSFSQQKKIDSLFKINSATRVDSIKISTFLALSDIYSFQNPDSAILLAKKAKQLSKKIKDPSHLAHASTELGWAYFVSGNYTLALDNFMEALQLYEQQKDLKNISTAYGNIGSVCINQKNFEKAREYYSKALSIDQKTGNQKWIASDLSNIGITYFSQNNYSKAIEYYFQALTINRQIKNKRDISMNLGNIGNVYNKLGEENINNKKRSDSLFNLAADYYFEAISIDIELERKLGIAIKYGNLGDLYTKMKKYNEAEKFLLHAISLTDSLGAYDLLDNWHKSISDLYEITNNANKALYHFKRFKALKDSINNIENTQKTLRIEMKYEFDKIQEAEKVEQDKKDATTNAELKRQKLIIAFVITGLFIILFFSIYLLRQKSIIKKEKQRSDELLLNILPSETAEELKQYGSAKPKRFEQVTVLFTDFKGFTKIAEIMTAEELVAELNTIFGVFDLIISKYPIEKIKTIGDAYMCAGGLPTPNNTHPRDVVLAALEIQKYIETRSLTKSDKPPFQIRIGIHTGPVVAGVVGIKKFAYDIWGDTVNTASRMESSGEPGKINISGSTFDLIKGFQEFKTTYRGEIEAKNKGKIKMYFIEKA